MKNTRRFPVVSGLALLILSSAVTFAQAPGSVDIQTPSGFVSYVKKAPVDTSSYPLQDLHSVSGLPLIYPVGATDSSAVFTSPNAKTNAAPAATIPYNDGDQDDERKGGNITGLVTVPTFAGAFAAQGTENTGQVFPYIMLGNNPLQGGTTTIPAHITTVTLDLLNPNGSFRVKIPYAPYRSLTLQSPNFKDADYTSGKNIQFADAIQRAEFFNMMKDDWHTRLRGTVVDDVSIQIPRFVQVQLPNGSIKTVQAYYVGRAADGSLFIDLLDLLFNNLWSNLVVNEIGNEATGNFQTFANNLTLFPNTYLFSINDQGKFSSCCVLGFHTYFYDSSRVPQPRWLTTFASWISPGLFGGGFEDVTALSHETSEVFDDPFGDTAVPVWQFPDVPANARFCQGNLETGDPVEVTQKPVFPVTIDVDTVPFTFHPQTEALLQWFEMGKTSNAIGGAFSYPNASVLPHSALPCPPLPPSR